MSRPASDFEGSGTPPDDDLAADYVSALLAPETEADVVRRVAIDGAFARKVENWRTRLGDFDISAEEIAPSAALWQNIEGSIAKKPAHDMARASSLMRWWHDLAALRLAAVGATAIALLCAGLAGIFYRTARTTAAAKPVYVAVLVSDKTLQAGAVLSTFADGHAELVPLVEIDVPDGRALQVWTLWDRGVGPRSLAVMNRARSIRLDLDRLPATVSDQLFEITLEPASGSPLGRPTGPILYKGTTVRAL